MYKLVYIPIKFWWCV